jgi:DNA-binding transcriptional regulator YdaS (Cro superfamily)
MCSSGRVPAKRVIAVERISGVSRRELRPDLYPAEQAAA